MSKFFKPEDFEMQKFSPEQISDFANRKLELSGKVVYDCGNGLLTHTENYDTIYKPIYKAILINIEPIEKCTHPKEKVQTDRVISHDPTLYSNFLTFFCECGVRVKPDSFKEVK